jgi:hypothetical protein
VGLAGIFVVVFLVDIAKRKFFSATAALLAFSMMIFVVGRAQSITEHTFQAIDIVRFSVSQGHYLQIIANRKDQTQRFSWGSGGFLGTNFFYTLVYRPDGPASQVSGKHEGCNVKVTRLREHFFVESEICQ